jgi:hypothetical protein
MLGIYQSTICIWVYFFFGTGVRTQGFTFATQVLYHLSHSASPFIVLDICKVVSHKLFARAVFELHPSNLCLPSS